jgi:hypothetical protein
MFIFERNILFSAIIAENKYGKVIDKVYLGVTARVGLSVVSF